MACNIPCRKVSLGRKETEQKVDRQLELWPPKVLYGIYPQALIQYTPSRISVGYRVQGRAMLIIFSVRALDN